jgi:hypothetical protein
VIDSLTHLLEVALVALWDVQTTLWPTTIAGWAALITSGIALPVGLAALYRVSTRPLTQALEAATRDFAEKMKLRDEACEKYGAETRRTCSQELNGFRASVEASINGWATRIRAVEDGVTGMTAMQNGIMVSLAEMRVQRQQTDDVMARIYRMLDDARETRAEEARRMGENQQQIISGLQRLLEAQARHHQGGRP